MGRNTTESLSISFANVVLLMNSKIIIPESLKKKVLKLGHLGMVKRKQRLRSMMAADECECGTFYSKLPCQVVASAQPPTPVEMTSIPKAAWLAVGVI